ncbi:MAG: hypothetical protein M3N51_12435 [Actinomycetota bacterium]|nr:hypothetical protein [Actinomycetota bacterium]
MERSLRLPALLGAMGGALLAVAGMVALSPLLLQRAGVFTAEGGSPQVVLQMTPLFLTVLAVVTSAIFGAVIAFVAGVAVPVLRPEPMVGEGTGPAMALGAVIGALLGIVAAFLAISVIGEQTETGVLVPLVPALLLLTLSGAAFGSATALAAYVFAEPSAEGVEGEEVRAVRHRLIGAVGMPVVAVLSMAILVLGLASLFLRFHAMAPLLGIVVAGGVLGFASLLALRPRVRIPATEIMLAVAALGIVLSVIVVAGSLDGEQEGEGHVTETTVSSEQPPDTTPGTSLP